MLTAITRKPSNSLSECELTFIERSPLDVKAAKNQHLAYENLLESMSIRVISLDANEGLPDSVFVEDTALVLEECAVMFATRIESRQGESHDIESVLSKYREIVRVEPPAFIDGGDLLTNNKIVFVGISGRTCQAGFIELRKILKPFGYTVIPANVSSALHLKTACTFLNEETVLVNPKWIDRETFRDFKTIDIVESEPFAANTLRIENTILMHSGFVKTADRLRRMDFDVGTLDIGEFQKAEAGLTCLSLVFV